MPTYYQEGRYIDIVAAADQTAGDFVVVNTMFGVAKNTVASGADNVLDTEGVYEFPKEALLAIAAGEVCHYDTAADEVDKTAANPKIGVCVKAALAADTTVFVKLIPAYAAETV